MFGYVRPWVPDLRVRDYEYYRALYCGLCRAMKKTTGALSAFSLNYDMVFLLMARLLYGERRIDFVRRRCMAHPFRRHREAAVTEAFCDTARISAILTAAKNRDDLSDERGAKRFRARLLSLFLGRAERRARMPELAACFSVYLSQLSALEAEKTPSVDAPAELSGRLLGEAFAYGMKEGRDTLYELGFRLGRVVYKIDALDDYAEDVKKDRYNPYRCLYGDGEMTYDNRLMALSGIRLEMERIEDTLSHLPFDGCEEIEAIMKNILYLGLDARLAPERKRNEGSV